MICLSQPCVDNKLNKSNWIFQSFIQSLFRLCTVVVIIYRWHLPYYGMSILSKILFIYNNFLIDVVNGSRSIQYIVRAMRSPSRPPFLRSVLRHQELLTTIKYCHVIRRWRNRFNSNRWNTKYCNDPTTARDRAMLDPCELGDYTRISLRCISTHANIWKPRGSQCWIEDIACLLFIRRYRRSRGTWEYGICAARRKSFIEGGKRSATSSKIE